MNILVCISSVPDTTTKINFSENGSKFDSSGVQFVINPYDEFGLTKAIMLKEKHGGKVTAITVGEQTVEPVIRKALAIGADEAIRVNMSPQDSYSTAVEISNYISENQFDLIICGKESSDYNGGVVGGIIAELVKHPFVNACNGLEISNNIANLDREIDGGKETLEIDLPLVIGGQKGLVEESELRIPNMRGIMQARTKPLLVLEPKNNDLLTESINFEKPSERGDCKIISSENISELVSLLQNEAKVI